MTNNQNFQPQICLNKPANIQMTKIYHQYFCHAAIYILDINQTDDNL